MFMCKFGFFRFVLQKLALGLLYAFSSSFLMLTAPFHLFKLSETQLKRKGSETEDDHEEKAGDRAEDVRLLELRQRLVNCLHRQRGTSDIANFHFHPSSHVVPIKLQNLSTGFLVRCSQLRTDLAYAESMEARL